MLLGMRILIFISDSSMSLIDALAILLTVDRKSTRLNSSHANEPRMPSSA